MVRAPSAARPAPPAATPRAAAPPSKAPVPAAADPGAPVLSGPRLCGLLRRLGSLAAEGFRSIDGGLDTSALVENYHKTTLSMPGAHCSIDADPKSPRTYTCVWPQDPKVGDQFVELGRTVKACMGSRIELLRIAGEEIADGTVHAPGVDYHVEIVTDFLAMDIKPTAARRAQ